MTSRFGKLRYSRRQITKRPFHIGSPNHSANKKVSPDGKTATNKEEKTPTQLNDSSSIGDVSVSFLASTPKPGKTQLSRRRPLSPVRESRVSKTDVHSQSSRSNKSNKENSSRLREGSRSQQKDISRSNKDNKSKEFENDSVFIPQNDDNFSTSKRNMSQSSIQSKRSQNISKHKPQSHIKIKKNSNSSTNMKQSKINFSILSSNTIQGPSKEVRNEVKPASKSFNRNKTTVSNMEPEINQRRVSNSTVKKDKINSSINTANNLSRTNRLEVSSGHSNNNNNSIKRKRHSELSNQAEMSVNKRRKVSQTVEPITINKTVDSKRAASDEGKQRFQPKRQPTKTTRTSPVLEDVSVKDISLRNKEDNHGRGKKPNVSDTRPEKKQKTNKKNKQEDNIPAQIVRIHESEITRKKSDVIDLDLVLSTLTETLETEMEECETQEEEAAIKLVRKYLVQDVSNMIENVLNVKKLQDKIKKGRKTLKERQKNLMNLQQKKSKLQIGKQSIDEERQAANNMKDINTFLSDMKNLIEKL